MNKNFLSIGTVVTLKKFDKRLVIVGFLSNSMENADLIYDYCAFPFPYGYMGRERIVFFNEDEIDKIYYSGYESSEEQKIFKGELVSEYNKIINKNIEVENKPVNVVMPVFTPITVNND